MDFMVVRMAFVFRDFAGASLGGEISRRLTPHRRALDSPQYESASGTRFAGRSVLGIPE